MFWCACFLFRFSVLPDPAVAVILLVAMLVSVALTYTDLLQKRTRVRADFIDHEEVPLVDFIMYLAFTRMPGETCSRRLGSFLCLCDVFRAVINSLVC